MATYDVAHLNVEGKNLVIVLIGRAPTRSEFEALKTCVRRAQLAGTVVPVWSDALTGYDFLAPVEWRSFLSTMSWESILLCINTTLTCE